MLSSRSSSIATQPMPPSLIAILSVGCSHRVARPQPLGARARATAGRTAWRRAAASARPAGTRAMPGAADVQGDHGVGLDARLDDRVPVVALPQRRQADRRAAARAASPTVKPALGVAADLVGARARVGEVRDARAGRCGRDVAGTTPRTASRSTRGCTARPSSRSGRAEEHPAAEPGDLRREVHRRPHAVDVHVAHAGVDVVATGPHLVEAERLELHRLRVGGRRPRSSRPG